MSKTNGSKLATTDSKSDSPIDCPDLGFPELALLDKRELLPDTVTIGGKVYRLDGDERLGEGLTARVWKYRNEHNQERAIKFCSPRFYKDGFETVADEIRRASSLEGCQHVARFIDAESVNLQLNNGKVQRYICFVEQFVDGVTLDNFLRTNPDRVTANFLITFTRDLSVALSAFQAMRLSHKDLHSGNIMVAEPPLGSSTQERRFVVIDTGGVRSSDAVGLDDYDNFAKAMVDVWNSMNRRRNLSHRDLLFLERTQQIIQRLYDDAARTIRHPRDIAEEVSSALDYASSPVLDDQPRLASPFDYVSADHIPSDRLLVQIFAKSCPWLDRVSGPDPCLITGPRGCGKSMMFRWLSLKAHLHTDFDEIRENVSIAGFYLSASSDLQNRLAWIRSEEDAEAVQAQLIDYFNLLLAREIAKTLRTIAKRQDNESNFGLTPTVARGFLQFFKDHLPAAHFFSLGGVSPVDQTIELVEHSVFQTQLHLRLGKDYEGVTTRAFLGDLTEFLTSRMPIFSILPIAFLVDDFSLHRISGPVQRILNTIIWERRHSHVFKLSAEKRGVVLHDELDASSEIARERIEIDCGTEYLQLSSKRPKQLVDFTKDLLNARLKLSGFLSDADTLIGPTEHSESSLAKTLIKESSDASPSAYHGIDCLSQLCTGDIASLLYVLNNVFHEGNVQKGQCDRIRPSDQHRAITDSSRQFLNAISSYTPHGKRMFDVVSNFGNLLNQVMHSGRLQSSDNPSQIPRIEIDFEDNIPPLESLTEDAHALAVELIRRAIFIELPAGRSRHGNVLTLRWHLRRIYIPAFKAALTKNDAVKEKPAWLEEFLVFPEITCRSQAKKWKTKETSDGQLKLDF